MSVLPSSSITTKEPPKRESEQERLPLCEHATKPRNPSKYHRSTIEVPSKYHRSSIEVPSKFHRNITLTARLQHMRKTSEWGGTGCWDSQRTLLERGCFIRAGRCDP